MEHVSYSDVKAISNYLGLGVSGTKSELLSKIKSNCGGSFKSDDETKDSSGDTFDMPSFQRQMSDSVNRHGFGRREEIYSDHLFGTLVFLDLYDDDENDRFCLKIGFPKTHSGNLLKMRQVNLYEELLKYHDRETLFANNIFVPTFHTTSGNLFVCELEIFNNSNNINTGRRDLYLKTANLYKKMLSPSNLGLFTLLKSGFSAAKFLLGLNLNINSLALESILFSNGKYYITDFSLDSAEPVDYARTLVEFINTIIRLYENAFVELDLEKKSLDKELEDKLAKHETNKLNPAYNVPSQEKYIDGFRMRIQQVVSRLKRKDNTDIIITEIVRKIMPLINPANPSNITRDTVNSALSIFTNDIVRLIDHYGKSPWSAG